MLPRWPASFGFALTPGFRSALVRTDHNPHSPHRLHPTSYLDGLRGLASLIVCLCHYTEDNHKYLLPSWGLGKQPSAAMSLPLFRLIYSGRPMVHIFFIISGFVLSYKPLKALHRRDLERCHAILASSAFRRPIRLFGPCVVSTFLIMILSYAGFLYDPLPTLYEQVEDWWFALFHGITWPWSWEQDLRPTYDIHLWTIPIEFTHSMLLFMVTFALSPMCLMVRLLGTTLIMLYCLACGRWAAFEFLGGGLMADVVLMQASDHLDLAKSSEGALPRRDLRIKSMLKTGLCSALVLAWCFVAGWPNDNAERTPGIEALLKKTPEPYLATNLDERAPQKFWFCMTATGLVWAITQMPVLQGLLENPFCQYLGRISYALYIVHGPILNMVQRAVVGHGVVGAVGSPGTKGYRAAVAARGIKALTGDENPTQQTLAWLLGIAIIFPVLLWVAGAFWRLVDLPITAASRRLEDWCHDKQF